MNKIETYSDYLIALRDQTAVLKSVQNEAKKALEDLRKNDPVRYNEYKARHEAPKPSKPSKSSVKYDKDKYIHEHPEINIEEIREKARARLSKDRWGWGLALYIPVWISQEEVLKSLDELAIPDLITGRGNLVQRETLLRKCMKIVLAERRINEERLRKTVQSSFSSYYGRKIITLKESFYFEPVRRMLLEDTTIDELLYVFNNGLEIDVDRLVELINSKKVRLTEEEIRRIQKKKSKPSKNALKRAKRRAEKEAALKKALEESSATAEILNQR